MHPLPCPRVHPLPMPTTTVPAPRPTDSAHHKLRSLAPLLLTSARPSPPPHTHTHLHLQLNVALSFATFCFELRGSVSMAFRVAKQAYDEAFSSQASTRSDMGAGAGSAATAAAAALAADEPGLRILQLLRDHLSEWSRLIASNGADESDSDVEVSEDYDDEDATTYSEGGSESSTARGRTPRMLHGSASAAAIGGGAGAGGRPSSGRGGRSSSSERPWSGRPSSSRRTIAKAKSAAALLKQTSWEGGGGGGSGETGVARSTSRRGGGGGGVSPAEVKSHLAMLMQVGQPVEVESLEERTAAIAALHQIFSFYLEAAGPSGQKADGDHINFANQRLRLDNFLSLVGGQGPCMPLHSFEYLLTDFGLVPDTLSIYQVELMVRWSVEASAAAAAEDTVGFDQRAAADSSDAPVGLVLSHNRSKTVNWHHTNREGDGETKRPARGSTEGGASGEGGGGGADDPEEDGQIPERPEVDRADLTLTYSQFVDCLGRCALACGGGGGGDARSTIEHFFSSRLQLLDNNPSGWRSKVRPAWGRTPRGNQRGGNKGEGEGGALDHKGGGGKHRRAQGLPSRCRSNADTSGFNLSSSAMGIMDEQRYEWRLRQIFGPFIEELYTLLLVCLSN